VNRKRISFWPQIINRFTVGLLLIGLLAVSAIDISGTSVKAAGKGTSFTIFFHFTPEESRGIVFRDLVKQYNEKHAGQVEIKLAYFADWQPLQEKTRTMTASGNPPDVFYFNYNPNDLSYFKSGQLMDFTPYMDQSWKNRFFASDLEDMTYEGKIFGIPVEKGPVCFIYNTKLLKKAGINTIPQTWDEFFAACKALKKAEIAPVSLFTSDDAWHSTNFLSYFAAEFGGKDVFKKSLDTPAMIKAADMMKDLFQYTTPDAIGAKWAISIQNFLTERTAILVDGPWVIGMINSQMPHPGDIVLTSAPVVKKGDPSVIIMDAVTSWVASKNLNAQQKKAVAGFLKYLTSESVAKKFAVEGKDIFAAKMNLKPAENKAAGPLLANYIVTANKADVRVMQITRQLKPAVMNELPSMLESLVMNRMTSNEFAAKLQKLNN
jgi:ABC-type glycerol-3-phosphate transport system substrate-binding protein